MLVHACCLGSTGSRVSLRRVFWFVFFNEIVLCGMVCPLLCKLGAQYFLQSLNRYISLCYLKDEIFKSVELIRKQICNYQC